MAFETIDHNPIRSRSLRRRRSPLEITLIAGFVFSLAIGFIALGVLFWMRTPVQAVVDANTQPAVALQPAQISPALALMELAGDPADALARQALSAGHADTAFAIAVYGVDLAPAVRRSLLQQVAHAYAASNRNAEAAIALHGARVLALLAPELTPTDRHQALLAIADTYLAIDAPAQAEDTLGQVLRAAVQTPGLLPAQRAEIFDAVRPLAQAAAADVLAAQASEYARNPFLNPTGQLPTSQLAALIVPPTPGAGEQSAVQQILVQAVEQRRFAARILAERIQLTGGIDIEPEQQNLASALQAEDAARADVYRNAQATASLTPGEQLWFLMERRTWLTQKARIAQGGFGLTLVPEWEVNAGFILQDLSTVHTNINVLVNAMSNDIADPIAQSALRLEVLKLLAQAWEFGLHPDGLAGDLGERMRIVQDTLASLNQRPALPIGYTDTVTPPGFRIQQE